MRVKNCVNLFFWKGAGVVELARLESVCMGNRTEGSNPSLSAQNNLI